MTFEYIMFFLLNYNTAFLQKNEKINVFKLSNFHCFEKFVPLFCTGLFILKPYLLSCSINWKWLTSLTCGTHWLMKGKSYKEPWVISIELMESGALARTWNQGHRNSRSELKLWENVQRSCSLLESLHCPCILYCPCKIASPKYCATVRRSSRWRGTSYVHV